jgi:hypothetical protein
VRGHSPIVIFAHGPFTNKHVQLRVHMHASKRTCWQWQSRTQKS